MNDLDEPRCRLRGKQADQAEVHAFTRNEQAPFVFEIKVAPDLRPALTPDLTGPREALLRYTPDELSGRLELIALLSTNGKRMVLFTDVATVSGDVRQ